MSIYDLKMICAACCYGVSYDLDDWRAMAHQGITSRLYLTTTFEMYCSRTQGRDHGPWMDGILAAIFCYWSNYRRSYPLWRTWHSTVFTSILMLSIFSMPQDFPQDPPAHHPLYAQSKYPQLLVISRTFRLATCRWKQSRPTVCITLTVHCRTRYEDITWWRKDQPIRQGKKITEYHSGSYLTFI